MISIIKRDYNSFFVSPIGYIFIGIFIAIMNLVFILTNLEGASSDLKPLFAYMLRCLTFLTPILTMRTFSEEYKMSTAQLLLTSPVSALEIVMGKFLSTMCVFFVALAFTLPFPIIVAIFGNPEPAAIIGNYIAIILAAGAYFSIGVFMSSLTENQLVAAILCLAALLFLPFIDTLSTLDYSWASTLAKYLSFNDRFSNGFVMGIFSVWDVFYYLSVTVVFLFVTTYTIDKKRYSE